MEKKFNIGDRVRSKFYGIVGTVIDVDADGYIINPDHVEEMWIAAEDAEAYDRKTDFLTRLSELMREFDVKLSASAIGSYCGDDIESVSLHILIDGSSLSYDMTNDDTFVTPSNILNYEKE